MPAGRLSRGELTKYLPDLVPLDPPITIQIVRLEQGFQLYHTPNYSPQGVERRESENGLSF